jgi:hypothetical protein
MEDPGLLQSSFMSDVLCSCLDRAIPGHRSEILSFAPPDPPTGGLFFSLLNTKQSCQSPAICDRADRVSRMSDLGPLADGNQMQRHFRGVPEADQFAARQVPATARHSGSPARRRPSKYLARSSGRRYGGMMSPNMEMRSRGSSCRSRSTSFCASAMRPASA